MLHVFCESVADAHFCVANRGVRCCKHDSDWFAFDVLHFKLDSENVITVVQHRRSCFDPSSNCIRTEDDSDSARRVTFFESRVKSMLNYIVAVFFGDLFAKSPGFLYSICKYVFLTNFCCINARIISSLSSL